MVAAAPTRGATGGNGLADYVRAVLAALAREEALGRRPARLTEAGLATWQRFRGRLGSADLVRLLAEDAAEVHAIPFDAERARHGNAWLVERSGVVHELDAVVVAPHNRQPRFNEDQLLCHLDGVTFPLQVPMPSESRP